MERDKMQAYISTEKEANNIDKMYKTLLNNTNFCRVCAEQKLLKCSIEEIENFYFDSIK